MRPHDIGWLFDPHRVVIGERRENGFGRRGGRRILSQGWGAYGQHYRSDQPGGKT
jgi:hypothetical protein